MKIESSKSVISAWTLSIALVVAVALTQLSVASLMLDAGSGPISLAPEKTLGAATAGARSRPAESKRVPEWAPQPTTVRTFSNSDVGGIPTPAVEQLALLKNTETVAPAAAPATLVRVGAGRICSECADGA